jgi:hypothetical protein
VIFFLSYNLKKMMTYYLEEWLEFRGMGIGLAGLGGAEDSTAQGVGVVSLSVSRSFCVSTAGDFSLGVTYKTKLAVKT